MSKCLNPSVAAALKEQAEHIVNQYVLGNKSTARAKFNQVQRRRVAYVTAHIIVYATKIGHSEDAFRLIASVTD